MDSHKQFMAEVSRLPMRYNYKLDFVDSRQFFSDGFNYWLNIPSDKKKAIESIVDSLLCAGYTIDDICDNSKKRRGKPTAFSVYGTALTANAVIINFMDAIKETERLNKPGAVEIVVQGILDTFEGQGAEIYWRDYGICPTIQQFNENLKYKAAGFSVCLYKLMQLYSENKTDYTEVANKILVYYQAVNDLMAINDSDYQSEKGCNTDITEGKFTLPIIHAIEKEGRDSKLKNILNMRTEDPHMFDLVQAILKKHGSIQYAKSELVKMQRELVDEVKKHGGNPFFEKLPNVERDLPN